MTFLHRFVHVISDRTNRIIILIVHRFRCVYICVILTKQWWKVDKGDKVASNGTADEQDEQPV